MFHCSNIKILRQNGGAGLESQLNWKHASIASTWSPVRSQNPCKNAGCGGTRRRQRQEDPGDSLAEFVALSQRTWASRLNTGFYRDILILFTHKEVLKRILVLQKKNHYDKPKRTRFSPQPILMLGTERLYPIPVLNPKNIWHK